METLIKEIKSLIIEALSLEDLKEEEIDAQAPLFGEGLGLDSIDALELGVALQKKFNVEVNSQPESLKRAFYSVQTMAEFIKERQIS